MLCVLVVPGWSFWGMYDWWEVEWGVSVLCEGVQVMVGGWGEWVQVTLVQVELMWEEVIWKGVGRGRCGVGIRSRSVVVGEVWSDKEGVCSGIASTMGWNGVFDWSGCGLQRP